MTLSVAAEAHSDLEMTLSKESIGIPVRKVGDISTIHPVP